MSPISVVPTATKTEPKPNLKQGAGRSKGDRHGEWPAVAGYPHLTVPMGLMRGLPVGLSFIGTRHADDVVLGAGYAYEQRANARVAPRYPDHAAVIPAGR